MRLQWSEFDIEILDNIEVGEDKERRHPYTMYMKKKFGQVERQLYCYEYLFNLIDPNDVYTYVEYFGGVGFNAIFAYHRFYKLENMYVVDIDSECCRQLKSLQFPDITYEVFEGNSIQIAGTYDCDVVGLDIPYITWYSYYAKKGWGNLLDGVFSHSPQYVMMSDSAVSKLHLNHKIYQEYAGVPISNLHDYMNVWSLLLSRDYGYSVTAYGYHSAASYMLVQPGTYAGAEIPALKCPKLYMYLKKSRSRT